MKPCAKWQINFL